MSYISDIAILFCFFPSETYRSEGYNPESPGITTTEGTYWPQRNCHSSGPYHNPAVRQRDLVSIPTIPEPTSEEG